MAMTDQGARLSEGREVVEHLVRQLGRQFYGALPAEDLRSAGNEGLVLALRDFNPALGVPFRRWANLRCKGAILDAVRAQGSLPRKVYRQLRAMEAGQVVLNARQEEDAAKPLATPDDADARLKEHLQATASAMALSLMGEGRMTRGGESIDDAPTPEDALEAEQIKAHVRSLITTLPDNERQLLENYYFNEWTLEQAGAALGLSKSWASRLLVKATESLTKRLYATL